MPGNSCRAAGEQALSEGAHRNARFRGRRRNSFGGHEAVSEGFRRAVRQHGGGGRDGRYSGHHSSAPLHLHREKRQAEARGEVRAEIGSTRLNSSHLVISYAVFCLKKKKNK